MESLKHVALLMVSGVSLLAVGILKSLFGAVFMEEWKAWAPRLAQQLLVGTVKLLPSSRQKRYAEEWSAALADIPGYIGKFIFALDLYRAGFLIAFRDSVEKRKADVVNSSKKSVEVSALSEMRPLQVLGAGEQARRPRVLVVDDEIVIANTLSIILNHTGYDAKPAYSGEEAVAVARDFRPEIMISDVIMTGMTGIETAIATRSLIPDCQIWLFAGQAATRDLLERAAQNGHVFNIMMKPTHPSDMLSRLRTATATA